MLVSHSSFHHCRGDISIDMFAYAEKQAYQMLKFGVFKQWESSEGCKEAMKKAGLSSINDLMGSSLL